MHRDLLAKVGIFNGLTRTSSSSSAPKLKILTFPRTPSSSARTTPAIRCSSSRREGQVGLYGDSGREVILSILRVGDFFGEMSLLDGQPRSANVIAIEKAETLCCHATISSRTYRSSRATALNILAEMSLRLRRADEVIGNLALLDVYGRVARVLMDLASSDGETTDEGVVIRERPTQQDLASMIGTSRETVSRVLGEFQRRGLLSMQGKKILLSQGFTDQELDAGT